MSEQLRSESILETAARFQFFFLKINLNTYIKLELVKTVDEYKQSFKSVKKL